MDKYDPMDREARLRRRLNQIDELMRTAGPAEFALLVRLESELAHALHHATTLKSTTN